MQPPENPREYHAFDAKDKAAKRGLVLRYASGETAHLKYPDIHFKRVSPDGAVMVVFYYCLNIIVWGKNLHAIASALDGEYVAWLRQYDAGRFDLPTDAAAPVIERFEVFRPKEAGAPQPDDALPARPAIKAAH